MGVQPKDPPGDPETPQVPPQQALVEPPPNSRGKLIREIALFLGGLGILLMAFGYLTLTTLDARAPALFGMPRRLALSLPLLAIGGTHGVCGILLVLTRSTVWAYVGTLSNGLLSLMYFVITGMAALAKGGSFSPNLLMFLFGAMPILLAHRTVALSKAPRE